MNIEHLKLTALAAIRELSNVVEFAEQTHEAIEGGTFNAETDTELQSAEAALIMAVDKLEVIGELLTDARVKSEVAA